jgi:hypothetical protein
MAPFRGSGEPMRLGSLVCLDAEVTVTTAGSMDPDASADAAGRSMIARTARRSRRPAPSAIVRRRPCITRVTGKPYARIYPARCKAAASGQLAGRRRYRSRMTTSRALLVTTCHAVRSPQRTTSQEDRAHWQMRVGRRKSVQRRKSAESPVHRASAASP